MIEFNITGTIIIYTVFDYEDVAFVADKDLIKHSENGYMYKITPLKAMSMLYPYLWALNKDGSLKCKDIYIKKMYNGTLGELFEVQRNLNDNYRRQLLDKWGC